jgi:hypothetical protein
VLGPNSKTTRSKPGLCAIRIAVSCAWVFAEPPVRSGQAVAGVLPGLAAPVGLGAAVAVAAVVGAAVAVRVGVAAVVGPVVGVAVGTPLGLGLGRGRTTRSGPQALSATTVMASSRAPRRRGWAFNPSIVTYLRCSVEFTYKPTSPSYAERTKRASTTVLR